MKNFKQTNWLWYCSAQRLRTEIYHERCFFPPLWRPQLIRLWPQPSLAKEEKWISIFFFWLTIIQGLWLGTHGTVQTAAWGRPQVCADLPGRPEAPTAAHTLLRSGWKGLGSPQTSARYGELPEPGPAHRLETGRGETSVDEAVLNSAFNPSCLLVEFVDFQLAR